jgi:formate dehydrogenase major subunit
MALWDLANADVITVMGSNMAENHPVAFRFVTQAQQRGATVIHVDPRFTRTSAMANIHAPIRSGTDIAFLGGLIRYILVEDKWFKEFALAYTNIATIIEDGFVDAEDDGGIFSGYQAASASYIQDTWQYKGEMVPPAIAEHYVRVEDDSERREAELTRHPPPHDATLQHPNCVYQIMRRHYARYTPEMVERVTGCAQDTFLRICEAVTCNSGRERTGAFCYAVGWTHHAYGVQIIRAAAIIQGLLGNIGRPGGGVLALRGHCSIQGSTDIPTLYNMLPTYLPQPNAFSPHGTLEEFLHTETVPTGWWNNLPKYMVSLLKAWYGANARKDNGFCYEYVPKLTGDHSQLPMTLAMVDGVVKGQFVLGQNPVVGAVNSELVQRGLTKLEWLVVRDFAMPETANFWQKGGLVQSGELSPQQIGTEVFFLPAAMAAEKEGTMTNTTRLVQWHDRVCDPPGESRSDLWFIYHLGRRLKELYAGSEEPRNAPLRALTWEYPTSGDIAEPDAASVLREVNGYAVADRRQLKSLQHIKDDGSTACGGWMYCGVFPDHRDNRSRSRKADGPDDNRAHQGWAFAWPDNRRTLYNRASADVAGQPWSERKRLIWWDAQHEKWIGHDTPDFEPTKHPDMRPDWSKQPHGMDALGGNDPFIMEADGKCMLFVPSGLKDGPLPTYYEPVESPVTNPLYRQQTNPAAKLWERPGNELHEPQDARFPYVFTTYRLTELHCGGISSRVTPHTAELQPEAFVELSPELSEELGIANLDWTVLSTARGAVEVKALVTGRLRPFTIDGKLVHQVGMPWVFGWEGYAHGAIANVLLAIFGDPNTSIHTTKALTCALRKGRLSQPEAAEHG